MTAECGHKRPLRKRLGRAAVIVSVIHTAWHVLPFIALIGAVA